MHTKSHAHENAPTLTRSTPTRRQQPPSAGGLGTGLTVAAGVPLLLDAEGVKKYLAPVCRTLLYQLAARGEIESASLGLSRGKRVFVTASVVQWLERRMAGTVRPKVVEQRGTGVGMAKESGPGNEQEAEARLQGGGADE